VELKQIKLVRDLRLVRQVKAKPKGVNKVKPELDALLDELRRDGWYLPTPLELLNAATEKGISVSEEDMQAYMAPLHISEYRLYPAYLVEFLANYLKEQNIRSLLNFGAGIGGLIVPLSKLLQPLLSLGIVTLPYINETNQIIHRNEDVQWLYRPLFEEGRYQKDGHIPVCDAIIYSGPFALQKRKMSTLDSQGMQITVYDSIERLIMIHLLDKLSEDGILLVLTTPSFFVESRSKKRSARDALNDKGFVIEFALQLPKDFYKPFANVPGVLIAISRKKTRMLFIGEISADEEVNNALLKNLITNTPGSIPELGAIVPSDSFRSFQEIFSQRKIALLAQGLQSLAISLGEVAAEI